MMMTSETSWAKTPPIKQYLISFLIALVIHTKVTGWAHYVCLRKSPTRGMFEIETAARWESQASGFWTAETMPGRFSEAQRTVSQRGQLWGSSCEGAEGNEAEVTRKWPHGPAGSRLSKQGDKIQDSGWSREVIELRMRERNKATMEARSTKPGIFFSSRNV